MTARAAAALALALVALAHAPAARADGDWSWLGPPRRISRSWSASRDTPALNLMILPRDVRTAGGELALLTVPRASVTVRVGFAGLIELESDGATESFDVFPHGGGAILWRGSYAYHVALALDRLGARLCDGCALEVTGQLRHESQHYTGSNHGDGGMDVSHQPFIGDDVLVDVALARDHGSWRLAARLTAMAYLPERSSYAGGAGLDVHVRWTGWSRVHPFVSAYGEYQLGDDLAGRVYPDAYLLRALAGVALPSALGDTLVYVSADVGHRKGVRGLTEEATLGVGVRLALDPR